MMAVGVLREAHGLRPAPGKGADLGPLPRGPGCATRQAGCALAAHWIIAPEQRNSAISWLADFFQIFGRGHFVGEFVEPLE